MADFSGFKIATSKKRKILFDYANTTPDTVQYSTQYNTIQYNAMQCNAIQYNTIQYNDMTIQYNDMTIQYSTVQ